MKNNPHSFDPHISFPIQTEKHYHDSYWKIVGRHQHKNILQLFLLQQGCGTFYCGEQYHPLKSGDYVLINCNEYHSFEVESLSAEFAVTKFDLELFSFYCPIGIITDYLKKIRYNQILFQSSFKDDLIRDHLLELIRLSDSPEETGQIKIMSLALDILHRLLSMHIESYYSEKDMLQLGNNWKKFHDIREYLETHYEEKITLEQAAGIAGMSKGYFCSKFKQNTGKSFIDYLNLLRVEKAAGILNHTDLPVIDVAMSVGYDDVNYFCRIFRKYMHQSPSEFRKSCSS